MKQYRKIELMMARAISKGARKLHLTSPTIALYEIELDGIGQFGSKSNSWVRNHINACCVSGLIGYPVDGGTTFFADGYVNFRDIAGAIGGNTSVPTYSTSGASAYIGGLKEYGFNNDLYKTYYNAGTSYGIVLGTSDTAESFNDIALGTKIAHGSSATQLVYNVQTVVSKLWDNPNRKWQLKVQRTFTNNSGSSIIVKELGYYTYGSGTTGTSGTYGGTYMILRDVLPSPITITAGQTMTVTYTFEYQY